MKQFKYLWILENYSYFWHDTDEEISSPKFLVEIMHSTSWFIRLFPRGINDPDFIDFDLNRCEDCNGPDSVALHCELSLLDATGRVLKSDKVDEEFEFDKGKEYGFYDFLERFEYHQDHKDEVSTSDILGVCCTMWVGEGKVEKEDFSCARTRIAIEKISFINIIENFSTLQQNQKKTFDVTSVSKDRLKFSGNIVVKREPDSEDEVMVEIVPDSDNGHLITCQIYLLSSAGKEVECGKIDSRNYIDRIDTFRFPINIGKNLLEKKREYLPNDTLTLRCECTLSTGIEFVRIEKTFYDLHLTPLLREKLHNSTNVSCPAVTNSVLEDFRNLYKDQILSDVQLKTINKTFHAHKFVLCARSPVFRAMLTTDMKEKMVNCIQIDDLEDNTIDQFLFFLYTDVLEDLQWESAKKLFYAAEKYQVQRLKDLCSTFLIDKLDSCNFSDLLIIADRHQDSSLKKVVQNVISKIKKGIFCTDEWESFMMTNRELASNTMHFYLKNSSE